MDVILVHALSMTIIRNRIGISAALESMALYGPLLGRESSIPFFATLVSRKSTT